jgi:hypothetical protein
MISRILRSASRLGLSLGNLVGATTGCFVFTRGFRLVAMNEEESHSALPILHNDGHRKSMAGIGAALLLLAFISSEAVATVVALHR